MTTEKHHKGLQIITFTGCVINLVLLTLSIIFAKERILFLDSAVYLFEMMNSESFFLPYHRMVNVFNQILPWIGIKLNLNTNVLVLLYSFNIQLVFTIIYLIIAFGLKQRKLALAIPLLQLMLVFESFYLPISELALGIAFLILLIAFRKTQISLNQKTKTSISILLGLIVAFSHPILIIPIAFQVFLEGNSISWKSYFKQGNFKLYLSIIALIILDKLIFFQVYESERTSDLLQSIMHPTRYEIMTSFYSIGQYLTHFPLYFISVIICLALLIQQKKWKTFSLYIIASIIAVISISLYMHKIYFIMPFFEIYLLPIAFFTSIILLSKIRLQQTSVIGLLSIFMLVQIGLITQKSKFFKERILIYESVLDEMIEQNSYKAIVDFYSTPMRKLYTMYDTPYAPLLISNMKPYTTDRVFTLFVPEDKIDMQLINQHKDLLFLGFENKVHPPFPIEELNTKYFNVDTLPYDLLEIDFSAFE